MTSRPVISLPKPATNPPAPAREIVAAFVELDDVFVALDALSPKRAPSRREWLAALAVRSPRGVR
jgi:hypothetical protein